MDKEVSQQFDRVHESIDKLAVMVANGFSAVDKRFEQVDQRFDKVDQRFDKVEADIAELRAEIRSIRTEIEELPDVIDRMYGPTINNLLDRVRVIEKKLGIAV